MKLLPAILLLPCLLRAASYYASPAASSGAGTLADPWATYIALTNPSSVMVSNDTLYIRAGTNRGNFTISRLNGVTIRSYPGEWAQFTDGAFGSLVSSISSGATAGHITGLDTALGGTVIFIGSEQIAIGDNSTATNKILNRGWNGTTAAAHSAGSAVIPNNPILNLSLSTNTIIRDLEVFGTTSTNRNSGTNWCNSTGIDCLATSPGTKLINLIIRNTGHPAIGFWSQGDGGEINGCIIWGSGVYDYDPQFAGGVGTPRGRAAYCQNTLGTAYLKNNITFRTFTGGLEGFGETGPVRGFVFDHNLCFDSPTEEPIEISSGSTPMTNNSVWTNFTTGRIVAGYQSKTNLLQNLVGNVCVNGTLGAVDFVSGIYTNNTIYISSNRTTTDNSSVSFNGAGSVPKAQLSMTWDYNTYYFQNPSHPHQFAFRSSDPATNASDGSGNLLYANDLNKSWQEQSGFDAHSIYATNWPTNMTVMVTPSDYDANRWHVGVVNTTSSNTVNLDLYAMGITNGQNVDIRDAQNYFVSLFNGNCPGQFYSLPLTLTNVADINGTLTHYTNFHTNARTPGLFNAFVVIRSAGVQAVASTGSGRSKGRNRP